MVLQCVVLNSFRRLESVSNSVGDILGLWHHQPVTKRSPTLGKTGAIRSKALQRGAHHKAWPDADLPGSQGDGTRW